MRIEIGGIMNVALNKKSVIKELKQLVESIELSGEAYITDATTSFDYSRCITQSFTIEIYPH